MNPVSKSYHSMKTTESLCSVLLPSWFWWHSRQGNHWAAGSDPQWTSSLVDLIHCSSFNNVQWHYEGHYLRTEKECHPWRRHTRMKASSDVRKENFCPSLRAPAPALWLVHPIAKSSLVLMVNLNFLCIWPRSWKMLLLRSSLPCGSVLPCCVALLGLHEQQPLGRLCAWCSLPAVKLNETLAPAWAAVVFAVALIPLVCSMASLSLLPRVVQMSPSAASLLPCACSTPGEMFYLSQRILTICHWAVGGSQ